MNTFSMHRTLVCAVLCLSAAACGRVGGSDHDGAPGPATPPGSPPPSAPTNSAPVANAGPDLIVELPTDSATLSGSATDDSLPTSVINYTWEYVSGPLGPGSSPGVQIANSTSAVTSARFAGGVGEYTLNLKADDGALTGTAVLHVSVRPNPLLYPGPGFPGWTIVTPADEGMDIAKLDEAREYSETASLGMTESGLIVRHGRVVYRWGSPTLRYEMKSTTKSIGGLALLLALDENRLALNDRAVDRLPVFGIEPAVDTSPVSSGSLSDITLLQLATQTAGFSKSDDVDIEPHRLLFTPGSTWMYSDQGVNWLADVLTTSWGEDLDTFLFSRIFTTLGFVRADVSWRNHVYRTQTLSVNGSPVRRREFASGLNANVNAMARIGLLMSRKGVWGNNLVLSNAIVAQVREPRPEIAGATIANPAGFPDATEIYGLLWWTNANGVIPEVPRDTFWSWGLHDTLIIVVPSLDLVIARAGVRGWRVQEEFWNGDYSALAPFLVPIIESVGP
jgi:CubicO group peptidase (beta-lactamase class C family)